MQQLSLNIEDYKFVITGIFLFLHGFIYFNLARGLFGSFDSSIGPSLTLKSILNSSTIELIIRLLWLLAGLGFILIGAFFVFSQNYSIYSNIILVICSIIGISSFAIFWDGSLQNLLTAGIIGVIIDAIILILILIL